MFNKKFFYITIGIVLLFVIIITLFSTRKVVYVYGDDPYEEFRNITNTNNQNQYEGVLHLRNFEVEGNTVSLALFDGEERVLEVDRSEIEVITEIDRSQLHENRLIPVYISLEYTNPEISFSEKLLCNIKSLPKECIYRKEPSIFTFRSFTFTDLSDDIILLLKANIENTIISNLKLLEGPRYSPSLDYEIAEYIYKYDKGILDSQHEEDITRLFETNRADLVSSFSYIPTIKNEEAGQNMIDILCEHMEYDETKTDLEILSFEEATNRVLANTYCNAMYNQEQLYDYIMDYEYEDINSINEKGLHIKTYGMCSISMQGDISDYCMEVFSSLVDLEIFWYRDSQICNRGNFDVFCSKEFLYTMYIIFSNYD